MAAVVIGAAAAAVSLVFSLSLPVVLRPLLIRMGIMDVPNARSSHERPVVRGIGLAVLIAVTLGDALGVTLLSTQQPGGGALLSLGVVIAGSLGAGLLGLREDLRGLSVRMRSGLLLTIAASVVISLLWIASESGGRMYLGWGMRLSLGEAPSLLLVIAAVYGVLFVSSYINVTNFMDGLNGVSGFHGVIAGVGFALAGMCTGQAWLVVAGFALAAGFAGFLPWNLRPPGAFLGDVGSYFLGGATATVSFAALLSGVPLLATIGPMVIYFGDVGVTLVRRVRRGERWDTPHKEHTYQRLQQLGFSHVAASGIAAAATLCTTALGLASIGKNPLTETLLLLAGLVVLVAYLRAPKLLGRFLQH